MQEPRLGLPIFWPLGVGWQSTFCVGIRALRCVLERAVPGGPRPRFLLCKVACLVGVERAADKVHSSEQIGRTCHGHSFQALHMLSSDCSAPGARPSSVLQSTDCTCPAAARSVRTQPSALGVRLCCRTGVSPARRNQGLRQQAPGPEGSSRGGVELARWPRPEGERVQVNTKHQEKPARLPFAWVSSVSTEMWEKRLEANILFIKKKKKLFVGGRAVAQWNGACLAS